jgi:virginiamycin B lyase
MTWQPFSFRRFFLRASNRTIRSSQTKKRYSYRPQMECLEDRLAPAVIATLYNTGVDNSGNVLGGGMTDPHYTLNAAPSPDSAGPAYVVLQNGFPFDGHWLSDGALSKWIAPHANENDVDGGGTTEPVGTYVYETTFSLNGFIPSTASISGQYAADNTLEQVLINGADAGVPAGSSTDFSNFHSFTISSGFVSGLNTLDFVVENIPQPDPSNNAHNPSGLRVEMTGTAQQIPDQPLSAAGTSIQTSEGQQFNGTVANFTDADPAGVSQNYRATIDWGDGQQTQNATITQPGGMGTSFAVSGQHTYAEEGSYTATVTITDIDNSHDAGGSQAIATTSATVTDPFLSAVTGGFTFNSVEGFASSNQIVATFQDSAPAEPVSVFIGDAGFETPDVGTGTFGSFAYNPSDSPWTFTAQSSGANGPIGSGVAGNNSGFTSANPNAPDGTQVGFIQGTASLSQSVLFSAGTYTLSFDAAQRGNNQASSQTIEVLVDGNVVSTITPTSTTYASYTTNNFTVTTGSHTIAFVGLNLNGSDNTAFIDAVTAQETSSISSSNVNYASAINWGDGSTSSGIITYDASSNTFSVWGNHTYAEEGTQTITTTITHETTPATSALSTASIADAPLSSTGTSVGGSGQGTTFTGDLAFFTDANPSATLDDFSAVVDWGDGSAPTTATVSLASPIADAGFETVDVGADSPDAFQYDPAGSAWVFSAQSSDSSGPSGSGLAADGSAFTNGNPDSPEGQQVAFIQGLGSFSQSVVLPGGTYSLSFEAAQRGNYQASSQSFDVLLDGTVVGSFGPSGTTYAEYTTSTFTVTGGSHTITFLGLNPNGGDNTAFVDNVQLNGTIYDVSGSHQYGAPGTYGPTVTISDVGGSSSTVGSAVTVADVPPVAVDYFSSTNENTPLTINTSDILANDADPNGQQLQVLSVASNTANGGTATLDSSDTFITYTPATDFFGVDTFQYTISDTSGLTAIATVSVTVNSVDGVTATLTADNHYGLYYGNANATDLTLVGRNEVGPSGNPGTYNWSLPETYNFNVNANDYLYVLAWNAGGPRMWAGQFTLPNGVSLLSDATHWQYTVATGANHGDYGDLPDQSTVMSTIVGATWLTPQAVATNGTDPWGVIPGVSTAADFVWSDTLTGPSDTDNHYVIFRTTAPALAPVAVDDTYSTPQDSTLTASAPGVLANDGAPTQRTLTAILSSGPSDGTLAFRQDGSFTYTPTVGFSGTDSFSYYATDGILNSGPATVTINVTTSMTSPATPSLTDLPTPQSDSNPYRLAIGDGKVFFTETTADRIGVLMPDGTINEIQLAAGSHPLAIAEGPDFAMYFTETGGIGRIDLSDLSVTEFGLQSANEQPTGDIIAGQNDDLYFTEAAGIGRYYPLDGDVSDYVLPNSNEQATRLAVDSSGNVWYTSYNSNVIGRLDPVTQNITEFPLPTPNSLPVGIALGPDGNMWFTETGGANANVIGQITPDGIITELPTPTLSSNPMAIVSGPDGNLWVTLSNGNAIARITPDGQIREFDIPTPASGPYDIVASPDGAGLVFTETAANRIGRVNLGLPLALSTPSDSTYSEGDYVSIQMAASGGAGDPYTYTATGLPQGVTIDPSTGLISGTIAAGAATVGGGAHAVTVDVTDGANNNTSQTFNVFVVMQAAKPKPTPFTTAIRANLALAGNDPNRWDRNNNGKITLDEIEAAMKWGEKQGDPPEVKGDAAAALATLKENFKQLAKLLGGNFFKDSVGDKELTEYERLFSVDPKTLKSDADLLKWSFVQKVEADFKYRQDRLKNTVLEFSPGSKPRDQGGGDLLYRLFDGQQTINQMTMGISGDCSFVAALNGLVLTQTKQITVVQHTAADRKSDYSVSFPGNDRAISVSKITQAQIALYSTAGKGGLWLTVLEKAYAGVRVRDLDNFPGSWFQTDAFDSLINGKSLDSAIKLLTNHKSDITSSKTGLDPKTVEQKLINATDGNAKTDFKPPKTIITAGTLPNKDWADPEKQPDTVPPIHAFAIIGYDPVKKIVKIQNPWNNNFFYPKYGGVFELSLADFCKLFCNLTIEIR